MTEGENRPARTQAVRGRAKAKNAGATAKTASRAMAKATSKAVSKTASKTIPAADTKTLGEAAYRLLRRDILAGCLPPGHKLQFRVLVQQYGLGIAPLREALSKLASERLVSFEGQRGFTVAPVSRKELHEVCTLWAELSAVALQQSIAIGDAAWEENVRLSMEVLNSAPLPRSPGDYEAIEHWEQLHSRFHMSLITGCASPWREHFCAVLCDQFERYRRIILLKMAISDELAAKVGHEHREIAEATVGRDAARAVRLLTEHFQEKLAYLDAHFEDAFALIQLKDPRNAKAAGKSPKPRPRRKAA